MDKKITIFKVFAQKLSLAKTARALKLPTGTIRYNLESLEEDLGYQLYTRQENKYNYELTCYGECLCGCANHFLGSYALLRAKLANCLKKIEGTVRWGVPPLLEAFYLGAIVERLYQMYPLLTLETYCAPTNTLLALVEAEQLDLALTVGNHLASELTIKPLYTDTYRVVQNYQDLRFNYHVKQPSTPWVICGDADSRCIWQLFMDSYAHCTPDKVMKLTNPLAVQAIIQSGYGLGLVPNAAAQRALAKKELHILSDIKCPLVKYGYVQKIRSQPNTAIIETCKQYFEFAG